jgi:hypothetical protein
MTRMPDTLCGYPAPPHDGELPCLADAQEIVQVASEAGVFGNDVQVGLVIVATSAGQVDGAIITVVAGGSPRLASRHYDAAELLDGVGSGVDGVIGVLSAVADTARAAIEGSE